MRLRHVDYEGRSWFYIVNTGLKPVRVAMRFPAGSVDLVSGKAFAGTAYLELGPYELRAFGAPSGSPAILESKEIK